jgi:hypothetical protein
MRITHTSIALTAITVLSLTACSRGGNTTTGVPPEAWTPVVMQLVSP